jgi:hypothetical protein
VSYAGRQMVSSRADSRPTASASTSSTSAG